MKLSKQERDKMICDNLNLVHRVIHDKFPFVKMKDYEDCFQVGSMAVVKAVDKFSTEKGIKLSTYIYRRVYADIWRYINGNREIHIPEWKILERIKNNEDVDGNIYMNIDTCNKEIEIGYDEDYSVVEIDTVISEIANGNKDIELSIKLKLEGYTDREIAQNTKWNNGLAVKMARDRAVDKVKIKWGMK